jgi:hypothetical protein
LPADGQLQDNDYVWRGGESLEPTLSLTKLGELKSERDWDFASGIAIGLAGAAAIALAQELPKEFRARRRED